MGLKCKSQDNYFHLQGNRQVNFHICLSMPLKLMKELLLSKIGSGCCKASELTSRLH